MPRHLSRRNPRGVLVTAGADYVHGDIPIDPRLCSFCHRRAAITTKGLRRAHRDNRGDICPGSYVRARLAKVPTVLPDLPALPAGPAWGPAPPQSPTIDPTVRYVDVVPPGPPPACCPDCGNPVPGRPRKDGAVRKHRIRPADPFAPWCGSPPPPRSLIGGTHPRR